MAVEHLRKVSQAAMIRGTKEWAVAEINCCIGCSYGCRYCYARAKAFNNGDINSVHGWLDCRVIPENVKREYPLYSGQVMFPAAHDIFPKNLASCLKVIGSLLKKGNRLLIVSKPNPECIVEICDTFQLCREQILFRFTITARNDDILEFWEPAAPSYKKRLESIRLAYNQGFATSVSIEPMLDAKDITGLVADLEPWVSHSIWIGKMNRIEQRVIVESEKVAAEIERIEAEQRDDRICHIYNVLGNKPIIRWKESIKEVVGLPLPEEIGLDT